jgi:hypothetical protein
LLPAVTGNGSPGIAPLMEIPVFYEYALAGMMKIRADLGLA